MKYSIASVNKNTNDGLFLAIFLVGSVMHDWKRLE